MRKVLVFLLGAFPGSYAGLAVFALLTRGQQSPTLQVFPFFFVHIPRWRDRRPCSLVSSTDCEAPIHSN